MAQITSTQTPGDICRTSYYNSSADCWRPTSCRECLNIKGCLVNQNGVCTNVTGEPNRNELRYTNAITQGLVLPAAKDDPRKNATQEWMFEAGQVAYCPDDDAVCSKCLAERFWSPMGDKPYYWRDSRFCIGANGCVCISNCEDINHTCDWLMESHLSDTNPSTSATPTPVPTSSPSLSPPSSSSSSSSSTDAEIDGPLPSDDKCRYSAIESDTCKTFRPCHECVTWKGCQISVDGYCERVTTDPAAYNPELDFRLAFQRNLTLPDAHDRNASQLAEAQHWVFPAFEVRYCPTSDPVCQRCTQEKFWVDIYGVADSRFCVGADGCVCIANCARSDLAWTCSEGNSDQARTPASKRSDKSGVAVGVGSVSAVAVVALVISWLYKMRTKAALRRDMPAAITQLTPEASAPPITPGADVADEHGFYSDGTSPSMRLHPSAPPTPSPHNPQASAPTLDPQPFRPQPSQAVSAMRPSSSDTPSRSAPSGQLELYGWISHRQHLIDNETRRLNGADDFVPPRNFL